MTTTITNTNNAPMTIKVEQLMNGGYITLAEQIINASKSLSLDFITQNTNPVRASFIQTGTGFEVEELSYAHLNKVASTDVIFISNDNPDFGEGYRFGFGNIENLGKNLLVIGFHTKVADRIIKFENHGTINITVISFSEAKRQRKIINKGSVNINVSR